MVFARECLGAISAGQNFRRGPDNWAVGEVTHSLRPKPTQTFCSTRRAKAGICATGSLPRFIGVPPVLEHGRDGHGTAWVAAPPCWALV